MTMLRKIIGWILLLCIIPLFAFTVIASGKEVKQMKSLDQVLDKNINLKDISLVQNSYMYDRDGSLSRKSSATTKTACSFHLTRFPRKSNRFS